VIESTRSVRGPEQRQGALEQPGRVANAPFVVGPTGPGGRNPRYLQHDEALVPRASAAPTDRDTEPLDLDGLELEKGPDLTPTVDDDRLVDVPAATAKNNRSRPATPPPPPPQKA
jgi:hypothetical protein